MIASPFVFVDLCLASIWDGARQRRIALRAGAATLIALAISASAQAIIVGNVPNLVPETTVNPVNYAGWSGGDPGWNNVVAAGSNYVYLGDGWVLSARHVGYNAANGVTFQTMLPNGSLGPIQTFHRIPGSYYFDYGYSQGSTRYYAVSNPTTVQSETGQTISLMDSRGTYFTDLQLFRINGDPGLPALTIASQPLPSGFSPETAPELVAIGRGRGRVANETHWNVTEVSSDQWTWQTTSGPGTHQGYLRSSTAQKRWGTNRVTDPNPSATGQCNPAAQSCYRDLFEAVLSDTTGVLQLKTADGATRDVISLLTTFDSQTAPGDTPLEFQGTSGDSGSAVFYKRGNQWELVGIVNAISQFTDQPVSASVYGNATLIADLSYYNQNYFNSIKYIMESHPDYSHKGDVNLDGVISGDGSGAPGIDDVTDFVLGWGYDNGTGQGTITSWKHGDLNDDGKTNVDDFLLLRSALHGQIPAAVVEALFGNSPFEPGSGAVPEPTTGLMAGIAVAWLVASARPRPAVRRQEMLPALS